MVRPVAALILLEAEMIRQAACCRDPEGSNEQDHVLTSFLPGNHPCALTETFP